MLKFIKHSMLQMDDAALYPMIALLLFGSFFIGWIIYSIVMPASDAQRFSQIPLEHTDLKDHNHE